MALEWRNSEWKKKISFYVKIFIYLFIPTILDDPSFDFIFMVQKTFIYFYS
jgi:hypothetical protein